MLGSLVGARPDQPLRTRQLIEKLQPADFGYSYWYSIVSALEEKSKPR